MKRRQPAMTLIFGLFLISAAHAEDCKSIKEDPLRLKCYDDSYGDIKQQGSNVADGTTAATKEIVKAKPGDPAKKIDAEDLAVAPNKYIGKNIEIAGVHCLYADVKEYRCLGPGSMVLMIVGESIDPASEKSKIEENCGEVKNLLTSACQRTIRFAPAEADRDKVGLADRTVVNAPFLEIVPAVNAISQRRRK